MFSLCSEKGCCLTTDFEKQSCSEQQQVNFYLTCQNCTQGRICTVNEKEPCGISHLRCFWPNKSTVWDWKFLEVWQYFWKQHSLFNLDGCVFEVEGTSQYQRTICGNWMILQNSDGKNNISITFFRFLENCCVWSLTILSIAFLFKNENEKA